MLINDMLTIFFSCVKKLLGMIEAFSDLEYIANGFRNGFKLGLCHSPQVVATVKEKSRNQEHLIKKLHAVVDFGRIIGTFEKLPIQDIMISPIYVIPKANSEKWRMIFDLSAPHGTSVNDNIPTHNREVKYCNIRDVVTHVLSLNEPDQAYFAKLDISDAYRMVPITKSEWQFLGIKVDGQYYIDTR